MLIKRSKRKALSLTALVALTALGVLLGPPAQAVEFKDADFSGYATGTYLNVDALTIGTTPAVKLSTGFSGASVASKGLNAAVQDKLGRTVSPVVAGKNSYGAGFGLDASVLGGDLLQQQAAAAAAPPSTELITKRLLGPITVPGVLSAGVVEGRAQARYNPQDCILGADLSYGQGDAADATLLGGPIDTLTSALLGTDPANQDAGAVRSSSRTRLVPQTDKSGLKIGENLGLMAETKQTLAPIVLFKGIPGAELTINVLGEWVMRAVATGIPGQAYIQYNPGGPATSGGTNVLSIQNTLPVVGQAPLPVIGVTLDQLLGIVPLNQLLGGPGGLLGLGLVKLELNPAPTITESPDGTSATGSVDVARVALLPGAEGVLGQLTNSIIPNLELADARIGHMEASAKVPAGGISCPGIQVTKTASPTTVNAGSEFKWLVDVKNPYDCPLSDVRLADKFTVDRNVKGRILGADPSASSTGADSLNFNDIGPIAAGATRRVTINMLALSDSAGGRFHNVAQVVSNCGLDSAQGGARVNVELKGEGKTDDPLVQAQQAAALPRTGGETTLWATLAVVLGAVSVGSAAGYRRLRTGGREGPTR